MTLALGFPHPDYLLPLLSSSQFADWYAYYALEPFGQYPEWVRTGIVASTIRNVFRGKSGRVSKPSDFVPNDPTPRVQSVDEQRQMLIAIYNVAKSKGMTKEK